MVNQKEFLAALDQPRIVAAIAAAERETSGEGSSALSRETHGPAPTIERYEYKTSRRYVKQRRGGEFPKDRSFGESGGRV